jgi:hypothetical protein
MATRHAVSDFDQHVRSASGEGSGKQAGQCCHLHKVSVVGYYRLPARRPLPASHQANSVWCVRTLIVFILRALFSATLITVTFSSLRLKAMYHSHPPPKKETSPLSSCRRQGGEEYSSYYFLTSALDEVSGVTPRPRFTFGKEPPISIGKEAGWASVLAQNFV